MSKTFLYPPSDICLNYTGKSWDTARTDGEVILLWGTVFSGVHTHPPSHPHTLRSDHLQEEISFKPEKNVTLYVTNTFIFP